MHPPPDAGSNNNNNNEEEEEEGEELVTLTTAIYGLASQDLQTNAHGFIYVGTDEHGRDVWAGFVRRAHGYDTRFLCDKPGRGMMVFLAVEDARRSDGTGEAYTSNVYSLRHVQFADGVYGSTLVEKYCFLYDVLISSACFEFMD